LAETRSSTRIASLDTLRVLAIFAVVVGHSEPFRSARYGESVRLIGEVYSQVARFCIPFFFAVSAYFFVRRLREGAAAGATLWRYLKRLLAIFVGWSAIYLILGLLPSGREINDYGFLKGWGVSVTDKLHDVAAKGPLLLALEGTKEHLWFLPSLMVSLAILALFYGTRRERYLLPFAGAVYAVGLLAGAYAPTPIGLAEGFSIGLNTRDGPFFGLIFVALGAWLVDRKPLSTPWAWTMAICGLAMMHMEAFSLKHFCGSDPWNIDYVVGTVPYGLGVFMLALRYPNLGRGTVWPQLGQLTLGV